MLGAAVVRSLALVIFSGFALFWSYNLFGSQYLKEDVQTTAVAPLERERPALSRHAQPLVGEAKLIAEILHSADDLGLKVQAPAVGSNDALAVKALPIGTGPVVEHAPPIKSIRRKKMAALRGQDSPPSPPAAPVNGGLIKTADVKRQAVQSLSEAVMSYDECQANYGIAKYLPKNQRRKPPVLYTFPGSGNTWARLLIDKASGVLSGSVYNDRSLVPALPGELSCDWSVSVVKAHPHTHTAASLLKGGFHSDGNMKCTKGQIRTFDKAVLLIRDPYDSIWSEYQRRASASHVSGIERDDFDTVQWLANAGNLANRYLEMWSKHYELLEKSLPAENILYVKYEDLTNKNKRISALKGIMTFIGFPEITEERIACAFALANSKHAKRSVDDTMITKKELYTDNKDLVCKMWATFGEYAEKHAYAPWNNYDCSDYSMKLVDMNVGPAGTLNRQWMMKRGIDMIKMKKGLAPVGDYSTAGFFNKGGRQRPDGTGRKTLPKKEGRQRLVDQNKEDVDSPAAGNLVGLGTLGKDKPAWQED